MDWTSTMILAVNCLVAYGLLGMLYAVSNAVTVYNAARNREEFMFFMWFLTAFWPLGAYAYIRRVLKATSGSNTKHK